MAIKLMTAVQASSQFSYNRHYNVKEQGAHDQALSNR